MDSVPGFHVQNFGCRATQADGAAVERQFEERGLARASAADADVVILNTCTVTAAADHDARAAIRRVQRQNPKARIVVTGCYAQRAPEEIAALPGVSCVVGNSHKHQLAEIVLPSSNGAHRFEARTATLSEMVSAREGYVFVPLTALAPLGHSLAQRPTANDQRPIFVSDIFAHTELLAAPVFDLAGDSNHSERTRPNLKVQDGCDNRCSFCVIPYVRGQSRSVPLPQIVREVNALVGAGYREIVISGINLGRWGRDLQERLPASGSGLQESMGRNTDAAALKPEGERRTPVFELLIRAILAQTSVEKLRISSVEPMDWTDELIALVAGSPRIAKHAHVPLQSGSDSVLRRMHRKYRPWHYREKVQKIRAAMPSAAIGADVMVAFPGETEAEFEATRRLIKDLPFTYLHVFTYSARPGTPAAALPNQVPVHVARERSRILHDLAADKKLNFMRSFIGQTMEAITLRSCGVGSGGARTGTPFDTRTVSDACEASGTDLHDHKGDDQALTEALTDNYLKLHLKGSHAPNRWLRAKVECMKDEALVGTV